MTIRKIIPFVIGFVLMRAPLVAQQPTTKSFLTNADIIRLVQSGFEEKTVLGVIEANEIQFDVSADGLIALKKAGISDKIIEAMVAAQARKKNPPNAPAPNASPPETASANTTPTQTAPPAAVPQPTMQVAQTQQISATAARMSVQMPPEQLAAMQAMQPQLSAMGLGSLMGGMFSASPAQMPHVFLGGGPAKQEITPSTAQIAQSKFKGGGPSQSGMMLRSLATEGLSFAALAAGPAGMIGMSAFSIASGFMPGMRPGMPTMTYVWGLPGLHSSRNLPTTSPMFELSYGEIAGMDPDGYEPAVVRLVQTKDNYRLVGATRSKMSSGMMTGQQQGKWVSEERLPVRLDKEERGFYVLHLEQPLDPGEYAVVLRPVKKYKPTTSGFGGAAQVFYSVWDFSIPGTPPSEPGKKKKK